MTDDRTSVDKWYMRMHLNSRTNYSFLIVQHPESNAQVGLRTCVIVAWMRWEATHFLISIELVEIPCLLRWEARLLHVLWLNQMKLLFGKQARF